MKLTPILRGTSPSEGAAAHHDDNELRGTGLPRLCSDVSRNPASYSAISRKVAASGSMPLGAWRILTLLRLLHGGREGDVDTRQARDGMQPDARHPHPLQR